MISSQPPSSFVWSDAHGTGRNVFAVFRRRFELRAVPAGARIHLFADTRYRLRVNGAVAAYGPARFVPAAPEFDTVDVTPFLSVGWNVLTVEVNSQGAPSFEALPSVGGFVAWGEVGGVDLATPGDWRARRAAAWDAMSPVFSFAQGPVEILDRRALPPEWFVVEADDADWPAAVVLDDQRAWGGLRARSIPMLSLDERLPGRVTLLAPLTGGEMRFGYREEGVASRPGARRQSVYAAHIFSPAAREVTLGCFWGPHYLNGQPLAATDDPLLGNRQAARLPLRAGWNFLYGRPETMQQPWPVVFSLPGDAGLIVAADPADPAAGVMRVASAEEPAGAEIPASAEGLPPFAWRTIPHGARVDAPARQMAWDRPGDPVRGAPGVVADLALPLSAGGEATAVFDFGGEFLGHAVIEIAAPPGTVLDVANGERLRADGCLDFYRTNWMINEADRFITRGGPETVEGFHPRGGRFLQITVRSGAAGPVTLRRVAVRQTVYPLETVGRFECSDPLFNWLWRTGEQTLRVCMEDAYLDCPWRERGCYTGDALVQFHVTRALTTGGALMRRCLWLFALVQRTDGQLPAAAPAQLDLPHADYSLLWIVALRDYWAATGDGEFVEEVWPCVAKIFASAWWRESADGLWIADGLNVFCDAGAAREAKTGESGPLNAFRFRALECAAELAAARGDAGQAQGYTVEAARVRRGFRAALWDAAAGRFAESRIDGERTGGRALHTNVLALLYGLGRPEDAPAVVGHVEAGLAENAALDPGHVEPYFFHFLLEALSLHGRNDLAERAVRELYAPMQAAGAWTLWEHARGRSSLCHAWSAAPLTYFSRCVLGVRLDARDPGYVVVAPEKGTLRWARGVVPHPCGRIEVEWTMRGDEMHLQVDAPEGVRVTLSTAAWRQ